MTEKTDTTTPRDGNGVDFPDWLPPDTASMLRQFLETDYFIDHPERGDALRRLGTDPRMETVWREITKKKRVNYRSTDTPLHRMVLPREWLRLAGGDEKALQREAPAALIGYLATLIFVDPYVPTRAKIKADIKRHRNEARDYRNLSKLFGDRASQAIMRARALESLVRHESRDLQWVLFTERDRTPARVLGIVRGVCLTMTELFGCPMHRTGAIIAGVLADYPVSTSMYQKHSEILKYRGQKRRSWR